MPASRPYQVRGHSCIVPRGQPDQFVVPADIEVRRIHEPCFMCGQREGCRHRRFA